MHPLGLAVRDQHHLVGRLAHLHQGVARHELPLDEAVRQRPEHLGVLEPPQQRQLAQLRRDDPHLRAGGEELHPAVPEGVRQTAVDPVGATGELHPRQQTQQPPRGDPLHLGNGLGRGRQIPGGLGAQTQPVRWIIRSRSGLH
ncbi:hypothetical protein GCM10020000_10310 [Streptomyces olivoverticillatus]